MDKIDLDHTDRKNLYAGDAANVFANVTTSDEIEEDMVVDELYASLNEAREHLAQSGSRRAYVVIRIER